MTLGTLMAAMLVFLISIVSVQVAGQQAESHWGEWKKWSDCSRSCGGGITKSNRSCISTTRDSTNLSCSGDYVRYRMCNIQDCPHNSVDYRMLQCSNFNTKPYKGKYYKWAGFRHSAGECELKCMPKKEFFYVTFNEKVADGTKCNDFSLDVCVNGTCVPVGCDMQLYSKARVDNCGICNGDGRKCRVMKGSFKLVSDAYGYVDVVVIPAGATGIKITEDYKTTNFLAVTSNGKNVLNADYAISSSFGTKRYQGHVIKYERSKRLNQIKIDGPIDLPLQFHVYVARYTRRPIIYKYEYYLPKSIHVNGNAISEYDWIIGDWSKCSKKCAYGKRTRIIYCAKKNTRSKVEAFNCDVRKPITEEPCATQACPSRWYISQWSPCSKSCGKGLHTRRVHCVETIKDGNVQMLDFSKCPGTAPTNIGTCYDEKFCPTWKVKKWSECSSSCGNGVRRRIVTCVKGGSHKVRTTNCDSGKKPVITQDCHNFPCGAQWVAEEWSQCSSMCGHGMRHRKVTCNDRAGVAVPRSHCDKKHEPRHFEDCQAAGICKPMWHSSEWSKCSAKCGYGMQIRTVTCAELNGRFIARDEKDCDSRSKPATTRRCPETRPCQVNYFVSKWGKCSVSCGVGYQMRDVRCYADRHIDYSKKHCENLIKPTQVQICTQSSCSKGRDDNNGGSLFDTGSVTTAEPPIPLADEYQSRVTEARETTNIKTTPRTPKPDDRNKITTSRVVIKAAKIVYFHGPADVRVNQFATYKCVANGFPSPGIDWSYARRPMYSFPGTYKITKKILGGQLESKLHIWPTRPTYEDELKCYVRNIAGWDSRVLRIKITGDVPPTTEPSFVTLPISDATTLDPIKYPLARRRPAKIVSLTGPVDLEAGENADYQCMAGGNPPPKMSWKSNGRSLDPSRFQVLNSERRSRLIIITSAYVDTGDLTCIATNYLGKDSSKLTLRVSGVPQVSINPKTTSYKGGDDVTLICHTQGSPTPNIQWEKDGKVFFGDYKRVLVLQDRIIFKGILPRDSGKFSCKGYNSQGTGVDSLALSVRRDDGTPISTCIDDNTRADCRLIASLSRLCSIPHYNTVCCDTCRGRA